MANVLPLETRVRVASALVEGVSIRGTERLTGVTKKTIARFGLTLGEGCGRLHDRLVTGLAISHIQCDEIYSYVHKRQKKLKPGDPEEWGTTYTWVAMDANSKLTVAYLVGKRDLEHARRFMGDLKRRLACRAQITSDGLTVYLDAVIEAFGSLVDFGQVVKNYRGGDQREERRYAPPESPSFVEKFTRIGKPDHALMSTSYVERQNLTMRMQMRRFTRLTNGFSKALAPLRAAVALHAAWFNFCRIHETLRTTPAMAAGVANHIWELSELVERALAEPVPAPAPPAPVPPPPDGRPVREQLELFSDMPAAGPARPHLRLIKGGKASANDGVVEDDAPDTVRGTPWGLLEDEAEGVG